MTSVEPKQQVFLNNTATRIAADNITKTHKDGGKSGLAGGYPPPPTVYGRSNTSLGAPFILARAGSAGVQSPRSGLPCSTRDLGSMAVALGVASDVPRLTSGARLVRIAHSNGPWAGSLHTVHCACLQLPPSLHACLRPSPAILCSDGVPPRRPPAPEKC